MIEFGNPPRRIDEDVAHQAREHRGRRVRLADDDPRTHHHRVPVHHRDGEVRNVDLDPALAHVARLPAPHLHVGQDRGALARCGVAGGPRRGRRDVGAPATRLSGSRRRPDERVVADSGRIRIGDGVEVGRRRALRFVRASQGLAQRLIALLGRIERGEPRAGIRRRRRLGQGLAGVGDLGRRRENPRDAPRGDARSARLLGVGDHGRRDGDLRRRERFGFERGRERRGRGETGQRQPVLWRAGDLRGDGAAGRGQSAGADPDGPKAAAGVERSDRRPRGDPVARAEGVDAAVVEDEAVDRPGDRGREGVGRRVRGAKRDRLGTRRRRHDDGGRRRPGRRRLRRGRERGQGAPLGKAMEPAEVNLGVSGKARPARRFDRVDQRARRNGAETRRRRRKERAPVARGRASRCARDHGDADQKRRQASHPMAETHVALPRRVQTAVRSRRHAARIGAARVYRYAASPIKSSSRPQSFILR